MKQMFFHHSSLCEKDASKHAQTHKPGSLPKRTAQYVLRFLLALTDRSSVSVKYLQMVSSYNQGKQYHKIPHSHPDHYSSIFFHVGSSHPLWKAQRCDTTAGIFRESLTMVYYEASCNILSIFLRSSDLEKRVFCVFCQFQEAPVTGMETAYGKELLNGPAKRIQAQFHSHITENHECYNSVEVRGIALLWCWG